ncbi:Fe-S cluster assembly protein SufD [Emticicia sp. CRIBPO]|nr:Fe-S cluster assembly protein SufD [Emticicia sp. CRIBPO]
MSNTDMQTQLLSDFQAYQNGLNGKAETPFNQLRRLAMDNFSNLGFPTTKHEEWKYSNVKKLVEKSYNFHPKSEAGEDELSALPIPDLAGNILYFINGIFHPELSTLQTPDDKLKIITLSQAITEFPDLLNEYYGKFTDNITESFTALNTAMANDGVVVFIPDNTTLEEPVIMRMIGDVREENVGSFVRNLVVVGKNAEVKIAESFRTLGEKSGFVNAVTEIIVGEDARVDYYKVQDDNDESFHIGTTQVYQKDRSYFYSATVTINGGFVRNNLNLILDGQHINSYMYGLYIPDKKQHIDNHTLVDHRKPNCQSNELYKGILMGKSTGVFNGKIFVQEDAQKTNAYQNCRNVIVSDSATMNTKPQLEIWADDVKCSHGTTTGKLNDDAIFYMQSRGIPKQEAIKLQLLAFAEDVVSQIKIDGIRNYLEVLIREKLHGN